ELYDVGTVATLQRVEALPDGGFQVLARGLHRFRLHELDHSRPYPMGRVERLGEPEARAGPRLAALLERYLAAHAVEAARPAAPQRRSAGGGSRGGVVGAARPRRQALLRSGDPGLAEQLLADELAKLGSMGRLGPFRPRQPGSN